MKRDEALQELSRDHFEALLQAREIALAVAEPADRKGVEQAADAFLRFWDAGARMHFVEEEEVLLSILSRHEDPTSNEHIRTMLDDHAWIRDGMHRLRGLREAGDDVRELLGSLGQRLHDHARLEERTIFEYMQEVFTDSELVEAGRRSLEFRRTMRGPDALGPNRGTIPLPEDVEAAD